LYINDLPKATKLGNMRLFADDANHFIKDKNYQNLKILAEAELSNIVTWMHSNRLTINLKKTNFTIFSPYANPLDTIHVSSVYIGNQQILRVPCIKYLGVFIDESLSWKDHIRFICTKIRKYCGIFYKVRDFIPATIRKQLYFALIHSTIQYGVEIYANTKSSYLQDLCVLNNRILRTLQFADMRTNISDLFKRYNALDVKCLFEYRLCLFVFKFLHYSNMLPLPFVHYFMQNFSVHLHHTRSSANLFVQRFNSNHGMRTLHYRAAVTWNRLPPVLKINVSLSMFKRQLLSFYTCKL
jgi:hypothetical protein